MEKFDLSKLEPVCMLMHAQDQIWPITRFQLRRNFARFSFPGKLSAKEKEQVLQTAISQISNCSELKNPKWVMGTDLSPQDKQKIYQRFLIENDIFESKPGIGFILDEKQNILISINVDDHLAIYKVDFSSKWEETMELLNKVDQSLNKLIGFAYDERFGFLTANPEHCGTGMLIEAFLHVPTLLMQHSQPQIEEMLNPNSSLGSLDNTSGYLASICIIRNRYSLGMSEDQLLHQVHSSAMKLYREEKTLRSKCLESAKMKDKISRSFALLKHSYEISPIEGMNALSDMLLAVQLNWIENMEIPVLETLFFDLHKAYLQFSHIKDPQDDISHKRAEFIHQSLNKANLCI